MGAWNNGTIPLMTMRARSEANRTSLAVWSLPASTGIVVVVFSNIGPKFLEHISTHVEPDLGSRSLGHVSESAVTMRVIGVVGDRCGSQCTAEFGVIELLPSSICARHKNAADGMSGTTPESSMTGLKIARILAEDRGKDGADHEVLDSTIAVERSIAFCVA